VETNLNMATFNNSLKVTDTLFIGSAQWIRQSSTNRLTSEGSIAAADTLLGALASITTKITLGVQQLTQGNTNRIDANNSVKVTDTLFIGANQYLFQSTINKIKSEGSIAATDTVQGKNLYVHNAKATINLAEFIGDNDGALGDSSGYMDRYGSYHGLTATVTGAYADFVDWGSGDTNTNAYGRIVFLAGDTSAYLGITTLGSHNYSKLYKKNDSPQFTTITATSLPTFNISAGTVTPVLVFDTIGFAVAGLTTNSIVIVSYGEAAPTADTIACVYNRRVGWLTLMGENGKAIHYWIPKK